MARTVEAEPPSASRFSAARLAVKGAPLTLRIPAGRRESAAPPLTAAARAAGALAKKAFRAELFPHICQASPQDISFVDQGTFLTR